MQFLELALQGVRGFSPAIRAGLRPGYCLLKSPGANQVPLAGLCCALLYPDGRGGDAEYKAPGQPVSRAALTLLSNDQSVYRLIRNLGGAGALQQLNKVSNQFDLLSEDPTEIGQFLRSQIGLPSRKEYELVFSFGPQQFPSRRRPTGKAQTAAGPLPPKPSVGIPQPTEREDLAAMEGRLAELQTEFALSKEVEDLQYRVDGISSKLFELEEKLKGSERLRESVEQAERAWREAPTMESLKLPADILERAQRFPAITAKYQQAIAKLDEGGVEPASRSIEPLHTKPPFWAAIGLGLAFFVIGICLSGKARYLALLDIPAFGMAAFLAINYVDDIRNSQRASRKGERLATRGKKIEEEYEAEMRVIKSAVSALQLESHTQIPDVLGKKAKLAARLTDLRQQLADYQQSPDHLTARSQETELKLEQEQLNTLLTEKGAYTRDAREVEREVTRLQDSIARSKAPPAPAPPAATPAAPSPIEPESSQLEDPFPLLLSVGADLFGIDLAAAGAMIRDRWLQFFSALTEQRYQTLELDKEARAHLTSDGQKVTATALPGADLDLLYLAARFALIEKYCARAKIPCLLDDVFVGYDEAKLYLLGRMLKQIGQMTQVLHAASQPGLEQLVDAVISV